LSLVALNSGPRVDIRSPGRPETTTDPLAGLIEEPGKPRQIASLILQTKEEVAMYRQKLLAVFSFVIVVLLLAVHPLHAQYVTTTIPVGMSPIAVAVNPATNMIYVANWSNGNASTITAIDGATNTTQTVSLGTGAYAMALNPTTNKIYVVNRNSNTVTVIDGSSRTTSTIAVGTTPHAVAVNPVTNKIYVANWGSNNITIIDGSAGTTTTVGAGSNPYSIAVNPVTNKIYVANVSSANVTVLDGATNTTSTIGAGSSPAAVAVNPVTNKIYVANNGSANVTMIDGASNTTATVNAGTQPLALAVNPVTNKIYVVNQGSNTVTRIDGVTNATASINVGSLPMSVAVNPVTNWIYVSNYNSNNVTMIDGTTMSTSTVAAGSSPWALAVNPVTNKIYVGNFYSNNVTVIDGATNSLATVTGGNYPTAAAVNPVTNKIYVANDHDNTVTVIDGKTNLPTTISLDAHTGNPFGVAVNPVTNKIYVISNGNLWAGVTVIDGASNSTVFLQMNTLPEAIDVNPVTNKIYVPAYDAYGNGQVTVIDGATNSSATVSTGGRSPGQVAVNPMTNRIYVANGSSNNVTVIDGATNSPTTVSAGTTPLAVAVNPVTNKIYVANRDSNTVTVIDGATNSTASVGVGTTPRYVAVNSVTNKIYVANCPGVPASYYVCGQSGSGSVTVIDGATNGTLDLTYALVYPDVVAVNPLTNKVYISDDSGMVVIIDGATNTVSGFGAQVRGPAALNPVTDTLYIPTTYNVVVVSEQKVQSIPLKTAISPSGWTITTVEHAPPFKFSATSAFSPTAPPPQAVWYQVDTWQGRWLRASGTPPTFTGIKADLSLGTHILYAFATDGQEATSTGVAQQLIGSMAAYLFEVVQARTTTALSSDSNPSGLGETVTFTATVTVNAPGSGTPTGSVIFYDGSTAMGTVATDSSGHAAYATSSLTAGSHSITAGYNGNALFLGSTSTVLTQVVQASTTTTLSSSLNPSNLGQTVTFTASVTVNAQGSGTPTGNVTFYDGSTALGTVALDSSGHAAYATSSLTAGSHSITASYGGDANFAGSTSTVLTQVVNKTSTTTALSSNLNPSNLGQTVTFTATVTGSGGTPTGNVTFYDSSTQMGTIALDGTGHAAYATASLTAGSHSITASYAGDTNFLGSTSPVLTQQVNGAGAVTLSPTLLGFGNVAINTTSAAKTVTLTNSGAGSLSINSIATSGSFAISSKTCGTTLAAAAKCTVKVTFTPTMLGTLTGTLTFTDNAPDSPQTVPLSGTGVLPATLTPAKATYAAQAVGTTSAAKTFTLTNYQTVALTSIAISTTGDFAVSATTCTTSLAAKGKCTISVTFTPAATGTRTGTLSVSDSANNSPQTAALSGTGVVPAKLTPASATYVVQTVGTTSAAKVFTLTNNMTVALTSIAISTTGDFAVSATTCTTSLAAKGKCTISVTFTPAATGTRTGQLSVSDSASNSPQTSALKGTGK
jgi:YVTN family beta-propeller protein